MLFDLTAWHTPHGYMLDKRRTDKRMLYASTAKLICHLHTYCHKQVIRLQFKLSPVFYIATRVETPR